MSQNNKNGLIIRRICIYGIEAREQYDKDHDQRKFINTVWCKINRYAGSRHVVENSTRAFLELTREKGINTWINGKSILIKAKINNYAHNKSYGLWPWLENTAAGIIQEQGEFPETSYKVKREFYDVLYNTVM